MKDVVIRPTMRYIRMGYTAVFVLVALALASIGVFNLRAELEVSALYFFCSYALGVLAAWGRGAASDAARERWGLLIVLLAACGLLLAWRDRLALAALCAALLLWQPERGAPRAGAWAAAASCCLMPVESLANAARAAGETG